MKKTDYLNSVNLKQNTDFPFLVLEAVDADIYPRNPGFQLMHWHEDLHFFYIFSGKATVVTLNDSITFTAGEGFFINKNVVHLIKHGTFCHYKNLVFPDYFLKFHVATPAKDAVEDIIGKDVLDVFHITNTPEHAAVLQLLQKLCALKEEHSPLYCYEVLTLLCSLWLDFRRIITLPPPQPQKHLAQKRMAIFLQYIEQHYNENISLAALAQSAHVSKSECLRCFKALLNTSPYKYLIEYRLAKAAEFLRNTSQPVGMIAASVGFAQVSHFGKLFKSKTAMTPKEYRKKF